MGHRKGTVEKYLKVLESIHDARHHAIVDVSSILTHFRASQTIATILKKNNLIDKNGRWIINERPNTFMARKLLTSIKKYAELSKKKNIKKNIIEKDKINLVTEPPKEELKILMMLFNLKEIYQKPLDKKVEDTLAIMGMNTDLGNIVLDKKFIVQDDILQNFYKWGGVNPTVYLSKEILKDYKNKLESKDELQSANKDLIAQIKTVKLIMRTLIHKINDMDIKISKLYDMWK